MIATSAVPGSETCRDGYFDVPNGLRLHFLDYPGDDSRPPLLCLHGLTRNARDFAEFAERYSPESRVIVLDFRGRGHSACDPVPARYTPLTYAADVQHLLDDLAIDQAIFVGTSLGGLVTMTTAVLAPHRIAGAILNDIGPELGQPGLDRIQAYVGKDTRFRTWEEAAAGLAGIQGGSFPNYSASDWLAMARRNCREEDGEIRFDYDMAIVEPFKTAGAQPKIDLWPLFMALAQKPLLLVRGALSELLTSETAEAMRRAAPAMHFVEVPAVGHAPDLDEPEAVAAIDRFLASLPAESGLAG
jgi:pimeloyl-ACP methyl ester carboxylesterase